MDQSKFISEQKFENVQQGGLKRSWYLISHYVSPHSNKYIYRDTFNNRIFNQPSLLFPSKRWFFMDSESAKTQLNRTIRQMISNLKSKLYRNHPLTQQILPELYGLNDKHYKQISWVFR